MNSRWRYRAAAAGAFAAAALLLAAAPAQAQDGGPRWQAWLGCWETSAQAAAPTDAPTEGGMLCVVPAARSEAVEVVSVANGAIESRSQIVADGVRQEAEREGCSGWESATWSAEGDRLYLRSQFTCDGGIERSSSGVMALAQNRDWIDVQAISAGANSGVQVARYRPVSSSAGIPAELSAALESRSFAAEAARLAAAARLGPDDVIEASRHLDPMALEAWLLENDQPFTVDARVLTQFADAGVPTRVIDLLVALSYPEVFAVDNSAREAPARAGGPRGPVWDPWYGPGYGYYPYGRRYGGWYGGYPAVIVVREPGGSGGNGGKAVKGGGYRRGGSDEGARPTSRPSSGGDATRAGSGGGSRGTSTGRTAKPKD